MKKVKNALHTSCLIAAFLSPAAVTFNDVMAAGIMRILHQQGITLPQQLSIVGFDDVVMARYLYPALHNYALSR